MSKQQTAVEWLFAELKNHLDMPSHHANEILQQAKEMEKEQMLKFGIQCQLDFIKSDGIRTVDDIYDLTYGGNK